VRTGGRMPGLSHTPPARRTEHLLVPHPARDVAVTAVVLALTAVTFVAVATPRGLAQLQRVDDSFLRLMVDIRSAPLTAAARFLNLLGLVYVTLPVHIALAAFLAVRRRWWHLSAFLSAIVLSEVLIGTLKAAYDRPRPLHPLVATSGASFPSGHSVAAAVTVVAAVIALVPSGRGRAAWGVAAGVFSTVMALSRVYLGAHWLSDAVAGVLLGTSCALLAGVVVGLLQRRQGGYRGRASGRDPTWRRAAR